jgi:hypothetical protein
MAHGKQDAKFAEAPGESESRTPFWFRSPVENAAAVIILTFIILSFFTGHSWMTGLALVGAAVIVALFIYRLRKPHA